MHGGDTADPGSHQRRSAAFERGHGRTALQVPPFAHGAAAKRHCAGFTRIQMQGESVRQRGFGLGVSSC